MIIITILQFKNEMCNTVKSTLPHPSCLRLVYVNIPYPHPSVGYRYYRTLGYCVRVIGGVMVGEQAGHLTKKYVDTVGVDAQLPALIQAGAAS